MPKIVYGRRCSNLPQRGRGIGEYGGMPKIMKCDFVIFYVRFAVHHASDKAPKVVLLNTLSNYSAIFIKEPTFYIKF